MILDNTILYLLILIAVSFLIIAVIKGYSIYIKRANYDFSHELYRFMEVLSDNKQKVTFDVVVNKSNVLRKIGKKCNNREIKSLSKELYDMVINSRENYEFVSNSLEQDIRDKTYELLGQISFDKLYMER